MKRHLEECQFNLNLSTQKMDNYKKTLYNQAERVREQIKCNIDMQIEGLNQRKNWLLNQLEVVKSDKLEVINRHQDGLNCEIYEVDKILSNFNKYNNAQIQERVDNVKALLSVETMPFIAFRADSGQLREFISQYGNVLNQYCGHFADPTRPSISLPRMVEEEDDDVDNSKCNTVEDNQPTSFYSGAADKDTRIIHITKRPEDSYVVKAWLASNAVTNSGSNSMDLESETMKSISESESFVKIENESVKLEKTDKHIDCYEKNFQTIAEIEKELQSNSLSENNDLWLLKKRQKLSDSQDLSDILKPFDLILNQNNEKWLLSPIFNDDEKDLDHQVFVNKACIVGRCKSFNDCSEKENCCNRLVDNNRPSWNRWLIDNNVIQKEMLTNNQTADSVTKSNVILDKFDQIMKSDKSKWLKSSSSPIEYNDEKECEKKPEYMVVNSKLEKGMEDMCIEELKRCECKMNGINDSCKWLVDTTCKQ